MLEQGDIFFQLMVHHPSLEIRADHLHSFGTELVLVHCRYNGKKMDQGI